MICTKAKLIEYSAQKLLLTSATSLLCMCGIQSLSNKIRGGVSFYVAESEIWDVWAVLGCFGLVKSRNFNFLSWIWFHLLQKFKLWVKIPALEGQTNFVLFSFHFQSLHTKLGIFDFNHFLISHFVLNLNQAIEK